MIFCEALLITTLFFTLYFTVRSDLKYGVIENKIILMSSVFCITISAVYYSLFAQEYFFLFIINLISMSTVSVILYAYDVWAAGDSKLMMIVFLAIPGRFYFLNYNGVLPGFLLLIAVFSLAFVYIAGESTVLWIKNKEWKTIDKSQLNIGWKPLLRSFLACVTLIFHINGLLSFLFPVFISENNALLLMTTFLLVLTVLKFPGLRSTVFISINCVVCLILVSLGIITIHIGSVNYSPYLLLLLIIFIRFISEKHNYKEIPTDQVMQGMILSLKTVIKLSSSGIKGLPLFTTEDLRSRLTKEEAGNIHRWGNSANGESTITIVRKIPFAIFIASGVFVFLILELIK